VTEPDVALTDYALAAECGLLAGRLGRVAPPSPLTHAFLAYLVSLGLAALTGGTVHGFFLDPLSRGARFLWPATLVVFGVSAWASWAIGARLIAGPRVAQRITALAGLGWAGYAVAVMAGAHTFAVAVFHALPAAFFLLVAFLRQAHGPAGGAAGLGALGVGVSLLAAGGQQAGIGLHPTLLSPNALAHVMQGVAVLLVYRAARGLTRDARATEGPC
jgi:uncharacterized protein DUF6962